MLISWLKSMEMLKIIRINANHVLVCNEATHTSIPILNSNNNSD